MSWYYAGPEAKPVGPLTLEDLQARRANGMVTTETYVIEQPAPEGATPTWKRYREVFPGASVPMMPPPAPGFPPVPPPVAAVSTAHPLFPSAAQGPAVQPYVPAAAPYIEPHASPHGHYPMRPTNRACAWGFGLGIASFLLCFACGAGLLFGVPALVICLLGFAQVQQRPTQSGRGMAVAGAILACIAILISLIVLAFAVPRMISSWSQNATQQNSD